MSIEQRIADALADLEALLTAGVEPEKALATCASDHSLKREVLELRARKTLGDLAAVRTRNLRSAEILTAQHKAETAIERYLQDAPEGTNYPAWFEQRVGRSPTKAEMTAFRERFAEFYFRDFRPDLD